MSDFVFNIAKGSVAEMVRRVVNNDPANSAIILVPVDRGATTDSTLKDLDTLTAVLGVVTERTVGQGNGWNRKTYTNVELTAPTVDDTNDWVTSDVPDAAWTPTADAVTDIVVCYDPDTTSGTDADIIPLTMQAFAVPSPSGATVSAVITGFHRSA
jgi:hypothetical protein